MAEDTAQAETGEAKALENNATTQPVVATQPQVDVTEVEKLRKEKEQAEMRANQLQNQLKAKEEAEATLRQKELEEQNKFKELFEQEKAKREAVEAEQEAAEKKKALEEAKTAVLADYSDDVKTLANEAGLSLTDSDEASVSAFKEKLDKISKLVGATQKVGPNNPNRTEHKVKLTPDELKIALQSEKSFQEIVSQRPGIALMMNRRNIISNE